jgi:hypothetical protein
MRSPPHRHASWWNFPPAQFQNSFTKTQVNRSWKKGIAMLSALYHAVLKFPNFHRLVENVSTKCATGIWPKEGVGVSGLGANAFSRRLAATPLCSRPRLHFALGRTSTLLCCSPTPLPRLHRLSSVTHRDPLSLPRYRPHHWYISTMQESFTRRYGQPWHFLFHFTIPPPAVLSATSQQLSYSSVPQSIPQQFSRSNFHAVPSFSNDHK